MELIFLKYGSCYVELLVKERNEDKTNMYFLVNPKGEVGRTRVVIFGT
jgi:hypothetical protein